MYLHVELDCANFLLTIKPHYFAILLVQTFSHSGVEKSFIFWDRNANWENFLRVVDTNPV
jgi:hypothetical protein